MKRLPKNGSKSRKNHRKTQRKVLRKQLQLECLTPRVLLAANVMNDTIILTDDFDAEIHVLANDTDGTEVQTVPAFNLDYDPASLNKPSNVAEWDYPLRDDGTTPQRSILPGAIVKEPGQANFGDVDLWVDVDGTIADTDDVEFNNTFGVVLASLRENTVPESGASSNNLSLLNFNARNGANGPNNAWISTVAAPTNDGESVANFGGAHFGYAAGWRAAIFDGDGMLVHDGGSNITAVQDSTGRYTVTVDGVTDSNSDGWLFSIAGGNSDNYTHAIPMGGNQWKIARRDNSATFAGGENGDFSVVYIPKNSVGLIGGEVSAKPPTPGDDLFRAGEFAIQREEDGLWRVAIEGQTPRSGMLILETNDTSLTDPGNVYLSYEADGDEFLIRQLEGNTLNPSNDDFVFFFVPFENLLNPGHGLSVSRVDATSTLGNAITFDAATGTISYDNPGGLPALGAGQVTTDTFTYDATDGTDTATGTVTVELRGVNDPPVVAGTIDDQRFDEDEAARDFDLSALFSDIDTGDTLTYDFDPGFGGLVEGTFNGSVLSIGPAENQFGSTYVTVSATDSAGASASLTFSVGVLPTDDSPEAVDDSVQTDRLTAIDIAAIGNDFHPDTQGFAVAAAEIFGNTDATGNGNTAWSIVASSSVPNELTIQSPQNRGDVAIGRNGLDLFPSDGVLVGTVRDNTSPYQTVNTYGAFGSYGFATDTGIGGGERNSPLSAGFFPFEEGWIGGQVASDGTLISGVGVVNSDITQLANGLWEVNIPGVTDSFFDDGMLFAMGNSNDDNIMSVTPQVGGGWLVGLRDSDSSVGSGGEWNGENDAWSFVYVPGNTPNLIGGQYATNEEGGGSFVAGRNYGGVTAAVDGFGSEASILLTIPNYTPAQGALIAISAGAEAGIDPVSNVTPPAAKAVMATPDGNAFRVEAFASETYAAETEDFYFMFLPFDQPLQRQDGLEIAVTSTDATSALGAAVSLNADGSINYNPAASSDAAITGLGVGEQVEDTFTYTISDGRTPAGTSTATVTITVTGENQAPTANDDIINLNEDSAKGATLTLTGNDTDPDFSTIFGTPTGIASANLAVDSSGVWSVAQSGSASNQISLGATATGQVELLAGGSGIAPSDGVVIATIRENAAATDTNLVQAFDNGGGTSLAISEFDNDAAANSQVAVSYFRFADNWIGGHVDASGTLGAASGIAAGDVVKTGVGRYEVSIPSISNADQDGFLLAIGNENADNTVSVQPLPGTNRYLIAVRDNSQNFGDGEDGGFSFVFVPRTAENLVAGSIDASSSSPNAVNLAVGNFTVERTATGEWSLEIAGQSPSTGLLVLSNDNTGGIEDNFLTYEAGASNNFLIRSHDMPNLGTQNQPFSFVFVPFDAASQPVYRPVPSPLMVTSTGAATSTLGATLSINADGTVNYDPGTINDALYDGDTVVDTFTYTVSDGFGGTSSATATINIEGVGQAVAVVNSPGTTRYGIGDQGTGIDPFLSLTDSPTPFLDGAVVTISFASGGITSDQLSVRNEGTGAGQVGVSGSDVSFEGTVVATLSGGTDGTALVLTLNSAATLDTIEQVLQAVTYSNSGANTPAGSRTVEFGLVDENGRSSAASTKNLSVGLLRTYNLQQGVDYGFGEYTGTEDVNLRQNSPDGVAPETDHLIDYNDGGAEAQVLLKFGDIFGTNAGQIPTDAIITSANLILETNPNTSNAPGDGARFFRMLTDWDETATWNSLGLTTDAAASYDQWGIRTDGTQARSEFDSMIGTESGAGSTGTGVFSLSVLPDVRAWLSGETNFGWVFKGWEFRTDGWFFSSSEDETPIARPRLEIDWVPAGSVNAVSYQDGVDGYEGTVDTQVGPGGGADTDNSAAETLFVDYQTANDSGVQALIRFEDIIGSAAGQIPAGAQIVSARLTTSSITSNSQGDGGRFFPILRDWADTDTYNTLVDGIAADGVEALATFNTAAGSESRSPNVQGGRHTWDVTDDLQSWVNGDSDNKGWAISPWESGTDGWGFQSSETPELVDRPRLEVYYTESTDSIPPQAEAIMVGSSNWGAAFVDSVDGVGNNGNGYQIGAGSEPLPWNDVDRIFVQFSEPVSNVVDANFELRNSTGIIDATVSYDSESFLATITLSSPLAFGKYRLGVSDQITDIAGNPLDGDAEGNAGGILDLRFDVVPGDGNRDGRVNSLDLQAFSAAFLAQAGADDYNPFADWNADGRVNSADLAVFSENFLNNIGTLGDPGAAFSGGASSAPSGGSGSWGAAGSGGAWGGGDSGSRPSSDGADGFFSGLGDDDDDEGGLLAF
ncbi:MAG TPA: hypothetical protein DDW52_30140 [Planctomycetaceae bacterium]|nr:hypothetical protein [Planctomycetaceae bacterium]